MAGSVARIGNGLYARAGKGMASLSTVAPVVTIPEPVKAETATLTIREVSEMTGVSVDTLQFLQFGDAGPAYTHNDGRTSYALADVLKWQRLRGADHARLMASIRGC